MISACNSALCYKEITLHTPAFSRFQDFYMDIISRFKILIAVISHVFGLIAQFAAQPLTVRCPANVHSCKHGGCLPGLSHSSRHSPSLSVARQMSTHTSMAAACRAYRAVRGIAAHCPLPVGCTLVQARRPPSGLIAQKRKNSAILEFFPYLYPFSSIAFFGQAPAQIPHSTHFSSSSSQIFSFRST